MKLPSFHEIIDETLRTFRRFPFVIMAAAAGTVAAVLLIDHEGPPTSTVLFNILFGSILGIPLLTLLTLIAERWTMNTARTISLNLVGLLFLVGYALTVPSYVANAPAIHIIRLILLCASFHFLVSVVPFWGTNRLNGFWQYNKTLLLRILMAAVFSGILFAGFAIALAALDQLFGIDVPGKRYPELFFSIIGIFNTWFFLAGVPGHLGDLEQLQEYPRSLKILSQYVLSPILIVYLIILYAYIGKILIEWEWPLGWVSRLVIGFSTTGILTLLFLFPLRDRGESRWIVKIFRGFFIVMIPLIIVLPIALWKRISLFGVTEGRYLGVLIGLWLALITIYFLFSRSKNIMVIPASLAVLALGMSFGPWSMFAISEKDQIARLEEILIRNKVLVDGHVQKAQAEVPFEDTKQISSILVYLDAVHGYRKIEQWFSDSLYSESNQSFPLAKSPSEVAKLMGIKFVQMWMNPDGHASVLSIDLEKSLSVEGYNRMIRAQYIITGRSESKFPDDHVRYQIGTSFDTLALFFERDGKDVDSICAPLRPVVDRVLAEYGNINPVNVDPEKMTAVASTATMKMKIYLRRVQLKRSEGGIVPESYSLDLLYSILPTVATKNQKK